MSRQIQWAVLCPKKPFWKNQQASVKHSSKHLCMHVSSGPTIPIAVPPYAQAPECDIPNDELHTALYLRPA
ncbi:MAG: hypothetical protein JST26_09675 [Bacteroidetes bacterium]|nr:hypothetical protein [Bacteroidota bacterium]